MGKIAIYDSKQAYLPEIDAYIEYFLSKGYKIERVFSNNRDNLSDFDLLWEFSGFFPKPRKYSDIKVLHEYNSLSTGKLSKIKDYLKIKYNYQPDARIYLNQTIKETLGFTDGIPSINRDMGISSVFYRTKKEKVEKEYDLVYVGAMDKSRGLEKLLFRIKLDPSINIIMVGKPSDELFLEFKNIKNITFTGKVEYHTVPEIASFAKIGVNYIPDIFPYNKQTSTKLIEYCAMDLGVVTTDYYWVNQFEKINSANFFKLNTDLSNLTKNNIENFNYKIPDVSGYEWNKLLEGIDLEKFILNILK